LLGRKRYHLSGLTSSLAELAIRRHTTREFDSPTHETDTRTYECYSDLPARTRSRSIESGIVYLFSSRSANRYSSSLGALNGIEAPGARHSPSLSISNAFVRSVGRSTVDGQHVSTSTLIDRLTGCPSSSKYPPMLKRGTFGVDCAWEWDNKTDTRSPACSPPQRNQPPTQRGSGLFPVVFDARFADFHLCKHRSNTAPPGVNFIHRRTAVQPSPFPSHRHHRQCVYVCGRRTPTTLFRRYYLSRWRSDIAVAAVTTTAPRVERTWIAGRYYVDECYRDLVELLPVERGSGRGSGGVRRHLGRHDSSCIRLVFNSLGRSRRRVSRSHLDAVAADDTCSDASDLSAASSLADDRGGRKDDQLAVAPSAPRRRTLRRHARHTTSVFNHERSLRHSVTCRHHSTNDLWWLSQD